MPVSRSEGRTMTFEIPPRSGAAFTLRCGEILQIIDPKGGQVSDMVVFMADDPREALSNGRTFDYEETIRLTAGHRLASNQIGRASGRESGGPYWLSTGGAVK